MAISPNGRTVAAIEKMMEEMQNLVDHPRIQQRTWVAKGKEWLPTLQHAKEDLQRTVPREVSSHDLLAENYLDLLLTLERVGLKVEKRDERNWGYRWFAGTLTGTFATRADAIEAALRTRLK